MIHPPIHNSPQRPKQRAFRRWAFALVVAIVAYATFDLFWLLNRPMSEFDPVEMARLETDMWRSYYDRKPVKLFFELAEVLRSQYDFPLLRSYLGAYHAARAAFAFKDGKQRSDYEQALPALNSYFGLIRKTGDIPFDVQRASTFELEWWIVHRERERHAAGDLGRACADAAAAVYLVHPDFVLEHGRLRAAAMVIRDTSAAAGGVRQDQWAEIEVLLRDCYVSLHRVISHSDLQ